jgi:TonB family protein
MSTMDANRKLPGSASRAELARFYLRDPDQDSSRKVAWVNSICILFLLIGVLGAKRGSISIKALPSTEEAVPAIIEPLPPPPQAVSEPQNQEQTEQDKPDTPQVVVVTPDAPSINFSVPAIGNVGVPNAIAKAPPLNPLRPAVPLKSQPASLNSTGVGGERPQPPYPKIALEQGQQGTVILSLSVDESGSIASVEVKQTSGFPLLDRGALEFVKRHWTVPPGAGARLFEATINYRLKTD